MQIVLFVLLASTLQAQPAQETASNDKNSLLQGDFSSAPTYIKSDSLALKSDERIFVYTGNVEVKQGDMILTADLLEGKYNKDNKIEQLVAKNNVLIVKGESIRANSERAVYESATETVVLTDNPELQQNGSVLTADAIKIFLKEDRSTAEGAVRVKVVNKEEEGGNSKAPKSDLSSIIGKK